MPRAGWFVSAMTKMFSGEASLVVLKFCLKSVASVYLPELMTSSAASIAAWQASWPPVTVIPAHEL